MRRPHRYWPFLSVVLAGALGLLAGACSTTKSGSGVTTTTLGASISLPTVRIGSGQPQSEALLSAVWCGSPTFCVTSAEGAKVVSATSVQTYLDFYEWDGAAWKLMPAQPISGVVVVGAISCRSASDCVAVGADNSNGFAAAWDGTRWSIVANPAHGSVVMSAVSCPSASTCLAVGLYSAGALTEQLAAGGWQIVPNPLSGHKSDPGDILSGLSCPSANACVAVGSKSQGFGLEPVAEHWDGASWSLQRTPELPMEIRSPGGALDSVACSSTAACLAVGHQGTKPLAEGFDGDQWTLGTPPSGPTGVTPGGPTVLGEYHLSCVGSTWCMAAGSDVGTTVVPSYRDYAGTWVSVAGPSTAPDSSSQVEGLSCPTRSMCLAVGWRARSGIEPEGYLSAIWDGTSWRLINPPPA